MSEAIEALELQIEIHLTPLDALARIAAEQEGD